MVNMKLGINVIKPFHGDRCGGMTQESEAGGETPENRRHDKPFTLIFGVRCTPNLFGDEQGSVDELQHD